jgi:hypothetical protein
VKNYTPARAAPERDRQQETGARCGGLKTMIEGERARDCDAYATQSFPLRCSEVLRRLDLAIETGRRDYVVYSAQQAIEIMQKAENSSFIKR